MRKSTIEKYYSKVTSVEKLAPKRTWYHVGENFLVETCGIEHDLKRENDLMNLWKRDGYIEKPLKSHIAVECFYTDSDGNCWGRYNITHKGQKLNFDYLKEYTPENEKELVAECIRLAVKDKAIA